MMPTDRQSPECQPRVAVVGASRNRRKYGNKAVRAFRRAGWIVYPVNLGASTIEELAAFPSLDALPTTVDRISVYLQPEDTLELLPAIQRSGCNDVWLNPGSADPRVLERCEEMDLAVVTACSIVAVGLSPADFP